MGESLLMRSSLSASSPSSPTSSSSSLLLVERNSARKPTLISTNQRAATHSRLAAVASRKSMAPKLRQRRHNINHTFSDNAAPQNARLQSTTEAAAGRGNFKRNNKRARAGTPASATIAARLDRVALVLLVATGLLLVCGCSQLPALADETSNNAGNGAGASGAPSPTGGNRQQLVADNKAALEAELNEILQQQELGQETNSKLLSEAIISRLMLGNLTDIGAQEESSNESFDGPAPVSAESAESEASLLSGPDAMRLRRVLSYLQNYELAQTGLNGGQAFSQYPVLPASQAATIKRASMKMSNYLRQQAQHQHNGQRQLNGYGRVNSFDFGLGKRPDSSVSGNILRFGDSASAGGHMAAVSGSGLGKRPSAHRYDFGLGKRVASPAYPRYDFGLGKRAPSRIRYDFGLGKK